MGTMAATALISKFAQPQVVLIFLAGWTGKIAMTSSAKQSADSCAELHKQLYRHCQKHGTLLSHPTSTVSSWAMIPDPENPASICFSEAALPN